MHVSFHTPDWRSCEVLSDALKLDRGMDRLWLQLPQAPQAGVNVPLRWLCFCDRPLDVSPYDATIKPGDLSAGVEVLLVRYSICLLKHKHTPGEDCLLDTFLIGQCGRCKTVVWCNL